jgi:predicted nucleic acid-binding protein
MPTSASGAACLLDTSAAVALLVADHEQHEATFDALADRELGLAGHAAYETFSVLTRLPPPARRTPAAVHRLLSANFPHSRFLSGQRAAALLAALAGHGIAGGSVYDALVGATALEHGLRLVSRDRRALETYRELAVDVEMIR